MNHYNKYLKYKEKYLTLKNQIGGIKKKKKKIEWDWDWEDQEYNNLIYEYTSNKNDGLPGFFYIKSNIKWGDLEKLNETKGGKFQKTVDYEWANKSESTVKTYQNKVLILEEANKNLMLKEPNTDLFALIKEARRYLLDKQKEFIYNPTKGRYFTSDSQDEITQKKKYDTDKEENEQKMYYIIKLINDYQKHNILFSNNYKLVGIIKMKWEDLENESIDNGYIIVDSLYRLKLVEFDKKNDVDINLLQIVEELKGKKWVFPTLEYNDKGMKPMVVENTST